MPSQEISIDIESILGNNPPIHIDIDKLDTREGQARQTGTEVKEDDKLVDSIRRTQGVLHPIIVKQVGDRYDIILGQRRWGAYKILVKEDKSRYSKIKAFVISKDLAPDEQKIISFVENFGRDDMVKQDYLNIIEYFYMKNNRKITWAAEALGITPYHAKKYLTEARLSDTVKRCINEKQFNVDVAIKALQALGDDEESVDDNALIATATTLKKLQPARRKQVINKMKLQPTSDRDVNKAEKEVPERLYVIEIQINEDQIGRIKMFQEKHSLGEQESAIIEAMDVGLDYDLQNN